MPQPKLSAPSAARPLLSGLPLPLQGLSLNYLHLETGRFSAPFSREGLSHVKGWKGTWGYRGSGVEGRRRDFPLWL